jgi:hypothetical protein
VSIVHNRSPAVQCGPAEDWPESADSDGYTWELGPDPKDSQWWADQNESWDSDEPVPDEVFDHRAEESEALDRLERGSLL